MPKKIKVDNWPRENREYDLLLGTLGYEQRATFAFSQLNLTAVHKLACGFKEQQSLHYEKNREWYVNAKFAVTEPSTKEFRDQLLAVLTDAELSRKYACVDISSMTRLRMAIVVDVFRRLSADSTVDFVYSMAQYSAPPNSFSPNTHVGAVLPSFAGWWTNPQKPPVAIVGLGYEEDKALGAVEHLQTPEIWTFIPQSEIPEYSDALVKANATLLNIVPKRRQIMYRVEDPLACLESLQMFVYGVIQRSNPILLPFGPKIFALCCLVTAAVYSSVAVWRVSPQDREQPTDRVATGAIYGIRVHFENQ